MCFLLPEGVCEDKSCRGAVVQWAVQLKKARKKGLLLAEGSGTAVAVTAAVHSQTWGPSDLSLLKLQLIVVKLSPLPTIKKRCKLEGYSTSHKNSVHLYLNIEVTPLPIEKPSALLLHMTSAERGHYTQQKCIFLAHFPGNKTLWAVVAQISPNGIDKEGEIAHGTKSLTPSEREGIKLQNMATDAHVKWRDCFCGNAEQFTNKALSVCYSCVQ